MCAAKKAKAPPDTGAPKQLDIAKKQMLADSLADPALNEALAREKEAKLFVKILRPFSDCTLTIIKGGHQASSRGTSPASILHVMTGTLAWSVLRAPKFTCGDIARSLRIDRGTAARSIRELQEIEYLEEVQAGVYRVEKGMVRRDKPGLKHPPEEQYVRLYHKGARAIQSKVLDMPEVRAARKASAMLMGTIAVMSRTSPKGPFLLRLKRTEFTTCLGISQGVFNEGKRLLCDGNRVLRRLKAADGFGYHFRTDEIMRIRKGFTASDTARTFGPHDFLPPPTV